MSTKPKSQTQDKFIIRLPDGMRDRIATAAEAAGRSMNAEIVQRLQESFELEDIEPYEDDEHASVFYELRDRLTALEEIQRGVMQEIGRHRAAGTFNPEGKTARKSSAKGSKPDASGA